MRNSAKDGVEINGGRGVPPMSICRAWWRKKRRAGAGPSDDDILHLN